MTLWKTLECCIAFKTRHIARHEPMIGKRIFQIVIHGFLAILFASGIAAIFFDWRIQVEDVLLAAFAFVGAVAFGSSVVFNWVLLRAQRWQLKLPKTLPVHYFFLVFSVVIVYFASVLHFSYDSHLSFYHLYADFFRSGTSYDIDPDYVLIAGTEYGIVLFLIYSFVLVGLNTFLTFGLLSNDNAPTLPMNRFLLYGQLLSGVVSLGIVIKLLSLLFRHSLWLFENRTNEDLMNSWNIGGWVSSGINIIILSTYAVWVMVDAVKWWRRRKVAKPQML